MLNDEHRDQETEAKPDSLNPAHPQMPANIDRPEGEREVDREGAVEQDGADLAAPDHFRPLRAALHRLEGDVAQAVIEKMQEDVRKQDKTAAQPEAAHDRRRAAHEPGPKFRR